MSSVPSVGETWRWRYHLAVLAVGLVVFAGAVQESAQNGFGWGLGLATVIAVPLIAVVARFPMILDSGSGAIEVGFDSSILIFLLCTLDNSDALVAWSLGVFVTQMICLLYTSPSPRD